MKKLSDYQLEDGTIFHLDDSGQPEFGDGLARFCSWIMCEYISARTDIDKFQVRQTFKNAIHKFFLVDGEPIRHYSPGWWSKSGTASGDQIIPLLCAYLCTGMYDEAMSLSWKIIKRFGFAWNTKKIGQHDDKWKIPDFILFRCFGLILRSYSAFTPSLFILYPIIILWDLATMPLSTILRCLKPLFDRDDTGDDLNYFHTHIAYSECYQTPITYLCREFYYLFRPLSGPPEYRKKNRGVIGCITAFRQYYVKDNAPPLDIYLTNAVFHL